MPELRDTTARSIKAGDKPLADGTVTGLRLHPSGKGRGQWKLRYVSPTTYTRRDLGLGVYPEVGLSGARQKAREARELIASGIDPIEERKRLAKIAQRETQALTFEQAARRRHEELREGFGNSKHQQQWINTLQTYVFPRLGDRKLAALTVSDFADVLRPIWLSKAETAQRVKQRCSDVMDWAWSQEMINGNPVAVVTKLLPRQPAKAIRVQHHPALSWGSLPQFFHDHLLGTSNPTRALLQFVILTAARSGEARAATWSEVDFDQRIWTVPAERMKGKKLHRVPLPEAALLLLEEQKVRSKGNKLIFPAPRGGQLSDMALTSFLRKHKVPSDVPGRFATAHGFRSTFRDWASEAGYPREVAERALAHAIQGETEAAYHRTDKLEQRREMMSHWANYATSQKRDK